VRYCSAEGVVCTPATTGQSLSFSQLENNSREIFVRVGAFSFEHFPLYRRHSPRVTTFAGLGVLDSASREQQHRRDAVMASRFTHLLSRGRDTVRAAISGDSGSQAEVGLFHFINVKRLDVLQVACLNITSADADVVSARWAEALRFLEMAAEQGNADAQVLCGEIYAGGRSVPQNWTTAVKWWRKAAEAGRNGAQWFMGQCYYYGRGVDRHAAHAKVWFRKAAAQGHLGAAQAVQSGIAGQRGVREAIVHFTNAGSAPPRHEVAHQFARTV
jgi:hypothetical protein